MSRTRYLVFVALAFGGVAGLCVMYSKSRTSQLFGEIVHRVDTDRRVVALTFDDGPHPVAVDAILPVLRRHDVRATFFVTGAELQRYPEAAAALAADGHELGNHTFSHERMMFKSPTFIAAEIERTDELIRAAGYGGEISFRPPYGVKGMALPLYLHRTARRTVMWDIEPDSNTQTAASSEAMVAHVIERAAPGSIVLLHVMYETRRTSLESVGGIIEALRARDFEFVTVSELLRLTASINPVDASPGASWHCATGVLPVGVLWGYGSPDELVAAGAVRLCESPRMLCDLLP